MKMGEGQRCKSGRRLRGESESVCELRRAWEKTLEDMGGLGVGGGNMECRVKGELMKMEEERSLIKMFFN